MTRSTGNKLTCLITGASSGLGWEFAGVCAERGHDLILVARREDRLAQRAQELSDRYHITAHAIPLDLSISSSATELMQAIEARNLSVDLLINNAGFAVHGAFAQSSMERQLDLLRVNIESLTHLTHLLLGPMIQRKRGRVLNVASLASYLPGPLLATYFASKAYVLSFSQALWEELRDSGVTVTTLVAGPTRSEFAASAGMENALAFRGGVMEALDVAQIGYRAMMRGKRIAVAGLHNRLRLLPIPFTPTRLLMRCARMYHEAPAARSPVVEDRSKVSGPLV